MSSCFSFAEWGIWSNLFSDAFSVLDWLWKKKIIFWSIWNYFANDCPISEGDFVPLNRTGRLTQQHSCWHTWTYQTIKMWVMSTKITACYGCCSLKWTPRVAEAYISFLRVSDLHVINPILRKLQVLLWLINLSLPWDYRLPCSNILLKKPWYNY